MTAEVAKRGFCASCHSEVPAARNPHRARNTVAAHFAAANLAQVATDAGSLGATGPYVCPHCGHEVRVAPKRRDG